MHVDPLLSLLIGSLGAAILTIGGAAVGAWLQSRREHSRWIREQRLIAYRDLLRFTEPSRISALTIKKWEAASSEALMPVLLVGSGPVLRAGVAHANAVGDTIVAAKMHPDDRAEIERLLSDEATTRKALVEAIRRELGVRGEVL
jgi:hypothetical protein